jgi:short-subunit dehydrogenase
LPLPPAAPSSTALVTGASSGIGAAIAAELVARGHGVTLVARREDRLRELAQKLESDGVRAEAIAADLADPAERDRLQGEIEERGLAVEILVNNAGFGGGPHFTNTERERLLEMTRLNVEAVVDLTSRFVPAMVARGRGAVINTASTASFQPMPGTANYAATKAFVLSLSEGISSELRPQGVTVTALCPGPVRTEFMEAANLEHTEEATPDFLWSTAEEVAAAAVRGAEQGKRVVVPGTLNRAGAVVGQHSPRALALPLVKRIWSSATKR